MGQEGHGAGQHGDDDEGPDTPQTQVDGQEEYAGADRSAKQADDPVGIVTTPASAGDGWGTR
ncbi:hypothetical protein D3C75_1306910 [compost metagenome]